MCTYKVAAFYTSPDIVVDSVSSTFFFWQNEIWLREIKIFYCWLLMQIRNFELISWFRFCFFAFFVSRLYVNPFHLKYVLQNVPLIFFGIIPKNKTDLEKDFIYFILFFAYTLLNSLCLPFNNIFSIVASSS